LIGKASSPDKFLKGAEIQKYLRVKRSNLGVFPCNFGVAVFDGLQVFAIEHQLALIFENLVAGAIEAHFGVFRRFFDVGLASESATDLLPEENAPHLKKFGFPRPSISVAAGVAAGVFSANALSDCNAMAARIGSVFVIILMGL
jgi:hypothetical protein